ncbi:MAG TPA: hypothetical protein VLH16_05075 [Bacteroidales bacterium]|nr:hypothetical protein [Bacteroidales bacterium]
MDKQHKSMKLFPITSFSIIMFIVITINISCKRDPEATHHIYIENTTNESLHFQITRKSISDIPGWERSLPPKQKTILADGALHLEGEDITFQTIIENFGLPTDTVEILLNDTIVIKWGGPLRVMPDSINHFYNEKSWEITQGGRKCRWERGTFTIYESDLGKIEGK